MLTTMENLRVGDHWLALKEGRHVIWMWQNSRKVRTGHRQHDPTPCCEGIGSLSQLNGQLRGRVWFQGAGITPTVAKTTAQ